MKYTYMETELQLKHAQNGSKPLCTNDMADHAITADFEKGALFVSERLAEELNLEEKTTFISAYVRIRNGLYPGDVEAMDRAMDEVLEGRRPQAKLILRYGDSEGYDWIQMCIMAQRKGKRIKSFSIKCIELGDAIERIGIHSKDLSEALRDSDMFNNMLQEYSSDYIYKIDFVENTGFFSAELTRLLGLSSYVIDKPIMTLLDYVSVEEKNMVQRTLMDFATGSTDDINISFRMITDLYGYIQVNMIGQGVRDSEGTPIMLAGVIRDMSLENAMINDAEMLSMLDPLTGLPNRYQLSKDLEARQYDSGALMLLDIDDFKKYNDMFGHSFGDKLILSVSRRLISILPAQASLYRFSGDEFIILWRGISGLELETKLEHLFDEIRRAWKLGQDELYSTLSMGIALLPQDGETTDMLLRNADIALHNAKSKGKNRAMFYSDRDGEEGIRSYRIETQLLQSMKNDYRGFAVYYQPIVDGNTGRWVSAEALLRWRSEQLGDISPIEIIPQLERMGFMVEAGSWVMAQALHECAKWRKETGRDLSVAVNLSAIQVDEGSLEMRVMDALQRSGLPPQALSLELTETTLMHNMENAVKVCATLRERGVCVALDDFGTGYSSLNYLRNLPVDIIKVDRSFVRDLERDKFNRQFILSIKDLAHVIQLSHCVEGVETHSQFEMLKSMKVERLQGYYFGKPMPAPEFLKALLEKEEQWLKVVAQ